MIYTHLVVNLQVYYAQKFHFNYTFVKDENQMPHTCPTLTVHQPKKKMCPTLTNNMSLISLLLYMYADTHGSYFLVIISDFQLKGISLFLGQCSISM